MEKYISNSEAETREIGREFAKRLKKGAIAALVGDLGCGKTAFVKGVVSHFGDDYDVTSPTFTIVNEYDGSMPVYHFDVYRLENPSPEQCDWMDDYFFGDGVCLVEWADNIKSVLPRETIRVEFSKVDDEGENVRKIVIYPNSDLGN